MNTTLHQLITDKIAELDENGAGPAADYFGVTKKEMAVIKRKKQYPFDFAERIFFTFDYEPDSPADLTPPEEEMYIEEPPAAPSASGQTPPPFSTAPMTVAPGVRPSTGAPSVIAPRTGVPVRAPGVVRVTPEAQGQDIATVVAAVLQALGNGAQQQQPHVIELPGGNAASALPPNFGQGWNRPYREAGPQIEPPNRGPRRSRPVIRNRQ